MRKLEDMSMRDVKYDIDEESQGISLHKDFAFYEKMKNSKMGQTFDDIKWVWDRFSLVTNFQYSYEGIRKHGSEKFYTAWFNCWIEN